MHGRAHGADARKRAAELLTMVGIADAEQRLRQYPHEFSGGMRQRVLIAMALACRPPLIIADEPTSALDVTVQRRILDRLGDLAAELGSALLLITHDLALAAERADDVLVMFRGEVVEQGTAPVILRNPQHQYTKDLLAAAPSLQSSSLTGTAGASATEPLRRVEDLYEGLPGSGPCPARADRVHGRRQGIASSSSAGKTVAIVGSRARASRRSRR